MLGSKLRLPSSSVISFSLRDLRASGVSVPLPPSADVPRLLSFGEPCVCVCRQNRPSISAQFRSAIGLSWWINPWLKQAESHFD
uniref:Uncharacterized protein n=1 Tax=Anopheles atroparvus TaxID=41427 RepID=A0AAG5CXT9_ANOAO